MFAQARHSEAEAKDTPGRRPREAWKYRLAWEKPTLLSKPVYSGMGQRDTNIKGRKGLLVISPNSGLA